MTDTALQQVVSGVAAANGSCIITSGPTQTNLTWTVSQISVNATPASSKVGSCTAAVYLNQILVCATIAGQQDVASNDPPVICQPGAQLEIQWQGCTPGSQCTALLTGIQTYPG